MLKFVVLACCLIAASQGGAQFGNGYYQFPGIHQYQWPHHQYQPFNHHQPSEIDQKQLFAFLRSTTTVTSTTTFVFTCTLSTTACGSGRRRRAAIVDNESHQFETISPSKVAAIEPTVAAASVRESREADPRQFYYRPTDHYGYDHLNAVHPGVPVLRDSIGDVTSNNNLLRWNFGALGKTVTTTSVVVAVSTSTSIPVCSAPGIYPQCALLG